jgi:hypothetical protein
MLDRDKHSRLAMKFAKAFDCDRMIMEYTSLYREVVREKTKHGLND